MTGHLTVQELEGFRNHTSAPQQLLRADRHLADCPECRRRLRAAGPPPPVPSLALDGEAPVHATYEQITAYIDGAQQPAELEWMEYHLQACAQCASEVKDLQQFDARMTAEAAVEPARKAAESGWRQRFAAFFATPQRPAFAIVSLSLLVIGLVTIARVQVANPSAAESHIVLTHFAPGDAKLFYGGLILAALGLAGVWYRFRKKK